MLIKNGVVNPVGTYLADADFVAENIKNGVDIYGVTGTYDAEVAAPIAAGTVLATKVGFVNGAKITGTMPNIGTESTDISAKATEVTISAGYHDGTGKVKISAAEQAKIIAGNIKKDVVILGVTGTYEGP